MTLPLYGLLLLVLITGCTGSGSATSHSTAINVTLAPELSEEIQTSLPPLQAAGRIAEIYNEFQFKGLNNGGLFGKARAEGDFFFARISALTATSERITATCQWKGENETTVTVKSTLPKAQHDFVVKTITAALARTSTQPS